MLDQHFMTDEALLKRIIEAAGVRKTDVVLEIGPGTGNLTGLLVKKCKHLNVIEKDKEIFTQLKNRFKDTKNISLDHDNAMTIKFPHFNKCVSNLPYTLCETLLWKFIRYKFDSLTLVVPKNFTDFLLNKRQSRLQYLANEFYNIEYLEDVYPDSFEPKPKVMSSLIRITPKNKNSLLKSFLLQYDKKTKNALRELLIEKGMTKQQAQDKISLMVRPMILNKNICNLSLFELETILKRFKL